jgi:hypothetical protein
MVDVSMTGEPPLRPRGREEQSDRRERQVAEGSACARLHSLRPTRIGTFAWPENAGGEASSLRPPGRLVVDHLLASGLSAALSAWQSDHDTARSFCLIHSYASDTSYERVRRRRPRRPGALS